MEIDILIADVDDYTGYVLKLKNEEVIFCSKFDNLVALIPQDKYFKTVPISTDEYSKLISKDITVAKMTSDIIIHRYTKFNIDEGEE